jgi:gamma-glutamyltranspeptidase/glutathione hydrolase
MTALSLLTIAQLQADAQEPARMPSTATGGMVSSAHPLATQAGLDLLARGGNAFDAAVAVAATLNVVEPMMSGLGGYGTILIYDSKRRELRFLNPSGRIPRAVDSDAFRPPTPGYLENRRGAKAVSTPGNLHAWEALARKYGTRPWSTLFDPAVRAAEDGYRLSELQAERIADAFPSFPAHAKAIYGRDGAPLAAGDRLVQRDLGRSLRLIAAEGAGALYGGPLGRAVDSAVRAADGFLSLEDLERDSAEWYQPISLEYRGYRVYTASPPANAFDALARLGMMSRYDVLTLGHNSADYLHRYAEVTKLGFWLRLRYAGDPEVTPPPVERLLSAGYLDSIVARIDTARASSFVPPGVSAAELPVTHTTHFVVADRWGNVVSATQTIGNLFGSRIMPEGTGIWLNNSLEYSTFEPKGNPMDAFAGRHKLSGDVPTIVMRDGRPWAAVGTPGGHSIGQTVPQMLINLIDFGMDVQAAIAAPRVSFSEPDELVVEAGVPKAVRDRLAVLGHRLRVLAPGRGIGNAHGLAIEYDAQGRPRRFTGGADPRGEGLAQGPK